MWKLIQLLFVGHVHQWEIMKQGDRVDSYGNKHGFYYDQKCAKCGDIRTKNT